MNHKKMKKILLSLFLCTAFILTSCSSANKNEGAMKSIEKKEASDVQNYGSGNGNLATVAEENVETAEDRNGETPEDRNVETPEGDKTTSTNADPEQKEQKLVYTCDMTMETLEYAETIKTIKEQIAKYHGIIQEENESDNNYQWYYAKEKTNGTLSSFFVIRIPAEHYQTFLDDLSGKGKITSKNMRVDNITKHYSEVETTIKSLKTQEKRLLAMMEQAKTVEDMITVETRLSEVQNELEQYKNALASLDTDITYSTINLQVYEVVKYEQSSTSFHDRFYNTLEDSKELFLDFMENGFFTLILFGPILLVIGLILFIVIFIIRRIRRKKRQKNSLKRFHDQIQQKDSNKSGKNVIKTEENPPIDEAEKKDSV